MDACAEWLATVAIVPVQRTRNDVPDQVVAEMLRASAAIARRAVPDRAEMNPHRAEIRLQSAAAPGTTRTGG